MKTKIIALLLVILVIISNIAFGQTMILKQSTDKTVGDLYLTLLSNGTPVETFYPIVDEFTKFNFSINPKEVPATWIGKTLYFFGPAIGPERAVMAIDLPYQGWVVQFVSFSEKLKDNPWGFVNKVNKMNE